MNYELSAKPITNYKLQIIGYTDVEILNYELSAVLITNHAI